MMPKAAKGKQRQQRSGRPSVMEKKNKKMIHLCDELIMLFLLRLPVKSVLRFKCVSKSWLSLIYDPNFAISHFELGATTHRLLCLPSFTHASRTHSIDLDASLSLHTHSTAFARINPTFLSPHFYADIKGSCRGFLLLRRNLRHLYLWNPSTNIHKPLSLSPMTNEYIPDFYGFGYDPSTDDYLVVILASYLNGDFWKTYFYLFSLRANAWEEIEDANLHGTMNASDDPRTGTIFNEIIHWLAYRQHDDVQVNVILAFDLMERSFSEVPLPNDFNPDFMFCDLCVLGGFLSLYVARSNATDIWVMKEYKVHSSWNKSIVVSINDLPSKYFSPICSSKSGEIFGLDCSTRLVKCNAKGQPLEHCSYSNDPHGCKAAMYRESLLSLPC